MAQPVLGDVELQLVQKIETDEEELLAQHSVPALEGDFLQRQKRRATQITLTGVLTGPGASDGLKSLRDKFRAAEPVPFVADISTAVRVDQMLIEEMGVRELAGKPERFEYAFTLREYIPATPAATEQPPETTAIDEELVEESSAQQSEVEEDIEQTLGELRVQVELLGDNQEFTNLIILAEGTTQAGEEVYFTIEEQEDGLYVREDVQAGNYTVKIARR